MSRVNLGGVSNQTIELNTIWDFEAHDLILKCNYAKVVTLYEKLIHGSPENIRFYYLLGLAYLLNRQEEEAQATWLWILSQSEDEELQTQKLIEILELEARRQESSDNIEQNELIRNYIYEINPQYIDNLLRLTLATASLGKLTLEKVKNWNLIALLKSKAFDVCEDHLIAKMEAEIARLYFRFESQITNIDTENKASNCINYLAQRFHLPYRLNIGCGKVKFKDWINIDGDSELDSVDLIWDVAHGLPFEDRTCSIIYNEHFLEHLSIEQGITFLQECHRILIPGGILRIAMPSLDDIIEKSANGNWRDQDWLTWPQFQFIQTRAEMLNISFRWWGHQWLYDREEIHRRLKEAGFMKIVDVEWGKSEVTALAGRETRKDSQLICEAIKQ